MVLTIAAAAARSRPRVAGDRLVLACGIGLGVLCAALAATILGAPLRHDEQMFVSTGLLFGQGALYRDFGFNHLPNLPILLNAVAHLTDFWRPLLVYRCVILLAWLATGWLLAYLARKETGSPLAAMFVVLLLVANPLLGGQAGTLVTNNFMPMPFALAGLALYLGEATRAEIRPIRIALAGALLAVAVGMKANYVLLIPPFAVAAICAPASLPLAMRLKRLALPLLIGAAIGGAPTLYAFAADPAGFIDHVVGYHRGPHLAWALTSRESLVISLHDRIALSISVWGAGPTLLLAASVVAVAVQLASRGWRPDWRVLLVLGLVATGIAVAFLPRPSFPQYFAPPLPFLLVLLILLIGRQTDAERRSMMPVFAAAAGLTIVLAAPPLLARLPLLARPAAWTGNVVHDTAVAVAAAAHGRPVATLAPIYALDGGAAVYPELAVGPFVYRVADLIAPDHRRFWRTVSASTLAARLDAQPPGAILVGAEGELDDAFRAYAASRGYRRASLPNAATRYGELQLYVPASASISQPPPIRAATSSRSSALSL
ncbi:hypothetical protein [Glacieibacterium sp.]|uniref:hypothetical protein n=1 Tax=Glacieibacterium sp. TaxID=2860237 RepID=UPI003B00E423